MILMDSNSQLGSMRIIPNYYELVPVLCGLQSIEESLFVGSLVSAAVFLYKD